MKRKMLYVMASLMSMTLCAQKAQVWDFGAEQLDATTYQNILSVDEINSWYPSTVTPGSNGNDIGSFTASDTVNLKFDGGGKSNHRIRTTNTAITRKDEKSLKDANNVVYTGYLYSNASSTPSVYVEQEYQANDKIEFYVGSNGGAAVYEISDANSNKQQFDYTAAYKIEKITYYAGVTGKHRIYCTDEKLVVARIVRTPATYATVSGSVTAPATIPANYKLLFTNANNGNVVEVAPSAGTYTAQLAIGYNYELSLKDANGFIIRSKNLIAIESAALTYDVTIEAVELVNVSGAITGLPAEQLQKLEIEFTIPEGKIYSPEITIDANAQTYTAVLESGVEYELTALNVNDYQLSLPAIQASADKTDLDIPFALKPLYAVTIEPTGASVDELKAAVFTFTRMDDKYVYTFNGPSAIQLRDGVYGVKVSNIGDYTQLLTSNLRVEGKATTKQIDFVKNQTAPAVEYKETITVGEGKDYATINEALAAVGRMTRTSGQRVTILIEPGNYEEMLRIKLNDITLKNASATPSIAVKDGGVNIDDNAVRITSYYGHGYNYYSMNSDYMWDARTLAVNEENGYSSVVNSGGSSSTHWNSTVVVYGKDFCAEGIIFENSYNQYISQKESEDILVPTEKPARPTNAGNTGVQARNFRERACALAFAMGSDRGFIKGCRIIGRQDALYGDNDVRVAVDGGILNGACDYIFGGMALAVRNAELAMLVTSDNNDVAYLTASKTTSGKRGYLFYECSVTSAKPEVDMVETESAKPGYFGRPWDANAETVFFNTKVGKSGSSSLIAPDGWNNGLVASGAVRSYEYGTIEEAGVDNSAKRVSWATVLQAPKLPDNTEITLFNYTKGSDNWDPFNEGSEAIGTIIDENNKKTVKMMRNGQLIIIRDGREYNAQGIEL